LSGTRFSRVVALVLSASSFACHSIVPFNTSARQFESSDATHPVMDAVGEGNDQAEAEANLRKAAVYAAARDLAQTDVERRSFTEWSEGGFFKGNAAEKLVSPGTEVKSRVINAAGHVELRGLVPVDRDQLERTLVDAGVVTPNRQLANAVDLPRLVLVPAKAIAAASWREPAENTHSAYLKQKKISVNAQKGFADIDIGGILQQLRDSAGAGAESDDALLDVLRADVLVQYAVKLDGGDDSAKATGTVKLYETTTGELLATGTSTSRLYTGTGALLQAVQESLRDAIDQAMPTLLASWKDYAQDGKPYLLLIRGKSEGADSRRATLALKDALDTVCSKVTTDSSNARVEELRLRSKNPAEKISRALEAALLALPNGDKLSAPSQKGKLLIVDLTPKP
jgi:hypothetical protein